jgi:hypothetical protein
LTFEKKAKVVEETGVTSSGVSNIIVKGGNTYTFHNELDNIRINLVD